GRRGAAAAGGSRRSLSPRTWDQIGAAARGRESVGAALERKPSARPRANSRQASGDDPEALAPFIDPLSAAGARLGKDSLAVLPAPGDVLLTMNGLPLRGMALEAVARKLAARCQHRGVWLMVARRFARTVEPAAAAAAAAAMPVGFRAPSPRGLPQW